MSSGDQAKRALPINADQIFVEWATKEGGINAVAFTDAKGMPFIGLSMLNRMGKPDGLPCWFRRSRFMSDFVIGFGPKPIVAFIDAEICKRGLSLIVNVPVSASHPYRRHLFAAWGRNAPRYAFTIYPTATYWPTSSFPQEALNDAIGS